MKYLLPVLLFSIAPAFAESSASLARVVKQECETYAKQSIAADYRDSRGGSCRALRLAIDPRTARKITIGLPSTGEELPVVEAYGAITIACNGALFFADETFTRRVRLMAGNFPHGSCSAGEQ